MDNSEHGRSGWKEQAINTDLGLSLQPALIGCVGLLSKICKEEALLEARDNQSAIQRIQQPGVVREEPCSSHHHPVAIVGCPRLHLPRSSIVLGVGRRDLSATVLIAVMKP